MTTTYNYRSKELSSELEQSQKDAGCLRAKSPIIARAQAGPGGWAWLGTTGLAREMGMQDCCSH